MTDLLRQLPRSFFWRPANCVPSLELLGPSHGVTVKKDVSATIRREGLPPRPLTVAELAGGKVVGDLRLVATRDDWVAGGLQTVFGCAEPQNHYALHRWRFRIPKYRPGTALLLGAANSDNYYHWLLDSLPRWKMLQAAGCLDYDYVLLHSLPRQFQEEALDRLGVPPAKRLRCSKNYVHQFERLVVPAMPFPQWQAEPWCCAWVRSLFPEKNSGPEKIYLSRHGAPRRRPVNEPELEARLAELGFVSIQPERLTVAGQAKLFSAARCIVAPHSAGLANLVFAPPGATLLELFHPQYQNSCYQQLAAACGQGYASRNGYVVGGTDDRLPEYGIDVAAVIRAVRKTM